MDCLTRSDIDRLAVAEFSVAWYSEVVAHAQECEKCRALLGSVQVSRNGSWRQLQARKESAARRLYRRILGVLAGCIDSISSWIVIFKRRRKHQNDAGQHGVAD